MIYDIRLAIGYAFGQASGGGRHLLRLLPHDVPGVQSVAAARLAIWPEPAERRDFTDFFGNLVTEVVLPPGHDRIRIEARARVERQTDELRPDLSVPPGALADEVASVPGLEPWAPHHYAVASPRIVEDGTIAVFARDRTAGAPTVAGAVAALGQALHREMRFGAGATSVETAPAEAFARRKGVCQDFAQIMIAGLRGIGVPAAYVSGYLRTLPPPGQPRLEGADAMHAWVAAWCGRLQGWVEYDPTNACPAGEDHVAVARGRDYGDVAPVAGILRLSGSQQSTQSVDVVPVDGP